MYGNKNDPSALVGGRGLAPVVPSLLDHTSTGAASLRVGPVSSPQEPAS